VIDQRQGEQAVVLALDEYDTGLTKLSPEFRAAFFA